MTTKRDTKSVLLETALDLIWSQSYGAVSVDDICEKAKAKKGSFYHYFKSKAELTCAALQHIWDEMLPAFDQMFSPQNPPLERLRLYAEASYQQQKEMKERLGYVVGCPFTSIGSEQCACKNGVSSKSEEILLRFRTYITSAIKDAVAEGIIPPVDPKHAAAQLMNYELGAMSYARISNSVEPMRGLYDAWVALLSAPRQPAAEAQLS